jgi:ABC-type cobalamin/Fe3+-siderophores transport system ATPase subunit
MSLQVQDLAFGYPGKRVGRDASFRLSGGEIVCLLGPNGCGKTTLFKTILGLIAPQGGRVMVDGEDLASWSRERRARTLAYVPQAHISFFPFRVLDTVLMGRTAHLGLFAMPSERDREAARQALEGLHVEQLAAADYTRISGGQRQLVLIARALAQEPRFLVMDEPTASLDFGNQVMVLAQVQRLAARGIGVIMSTHAPDQAFACADRVLLMQDGRIVAEGEPEAVLTSERLREVYGVEVCVSRVPGLERPVCVPRLERLAPMAPDAGGQRIGR